jgi:hypothetical protein
MKTNQNSRRREPCEAPFHIRSKLIALKLDGCQLVSKCKHRATARPRFEFEGAFIAYDLTNLRLIFRRFMIHRYISIVRN